MFDLNISLIVWILLGIQIISVPLVLWLVLRPLRLIRRLPIDYSTEHPEELPTEYSSEQPEELPTDNSSEHPESRAIPKVSVVVYSTVNEETLTNFLHSVCRQDYPDFEVIVVCDASSEASDILSEKYCDLFKNVYVTFIPPESHNLSRRKLALTLGIKAAKGDVILTTVANAVIPSDRWISTLAAPFISDPQIELSLGYSRHDYTELGSSSRRYKEFFAFLTDARWIGYALMKKAYRGDGFNLAFRRETFFSRKGYSKTINLHTGEDDLFVHDIATPYNTAVAISPDAIITTRWQDSSKRIFNLRRSQYDFTARWLPLGPFVRAGLASTAQWIILLTGIAAALIALPNLLPAVIAFIVWLIFIIAESSIFSKAARILEAEVPSGDVPLFWLIKPINNMWFRAVHRSSRFKNFTWQRHKLS